MAERQQVPKAEAPVAPTVDPTRAAAAKAVISAEPRVKDILYDPAATVAWQIGVLGDGSPEYGYADYICQILREKGVDDPDAIVRIVDLAVLARHEGDFRGASLGAIVCRDRSHFDDAPAARG
ncbi:MAG: hypothetical protein ABIW58_08550 [Sphingomicrobium sp.]